MRLRIGVAGSHLITPVTALPSPAASSAPPQASGMLWTSLPPAASSSRRTERRLRPDSGFPGTPSSSGSLCSQRISVAVAQRHAGSYWIAHASAWKASAVSDVALAGWSSAHLAWRIATGLRAKAVSKWAQSAGEKHARACWRGAKKLTSLPAESRRATKPSSQFPARRSCASPTTFDMSKPSTKGTKVAQATPSRPSSQWGFLASAAMLTPFLLAIGLLSSHLHYTLPTPGTESYAPDGTTPIFNEATAMK